MQRLRWRCHSKLLQGHCTKLKSPYLSRELSDFDQTWYVGANFHSEGGHLTKNRNFANSRWRTDAVLKIVFAISQRHIGWLMLNLDQRWRITVHSLTVHYLWWCMPPFIRRCWGLPHRLTSPPPFPFGRICFVVLVMRKGGESSSSGPWYLGCTLEIWKFSMCTATRISSYNPVGPSVFFVYLA